MSTSIKTPRGWTLLYSTPGGWISPQVGAMEGPRADAATRVQRANIAEYPGYQQTLKQDANDATVWYLAVGLQTPEGASPSLATYLFKMVSQTRPMFPADFSASLWPWIAAAGGSLVIVLLIVSGTKKRGGRR